MRVSIYFSDLYPYKALENIEILEPQFIQKALLQEKIKTLFQTFDIDLIEQEILDFKSKISVIIESEYFHNKSSDFKDFWNFFLYEYKIIWNHQEKTVLKSILSLPLSSEDAERR